MARINRLQKSDVKAFLKGYSEANRLVQTEKGKRLRMLSWRKSLREFDVLCKTWELINSKGKMERLENKNIQLLVSTRKLFDKAGKRST